MDGLGGGGGGARGEGGEEGLVAGWFISYKTPEAVTTLKEQENVCIALIQKNSLLELSLELSINECTYQYPFFRNNHYYDSPNLSYRCCGKNR